MTSKEMVVSFALHCNSDGPFSHFRFLSVFWTTLPLFIRLSDHFRLFLFSFPSLAHFGEMCSLERGAKSFSLTFNTESTEWQTDRAEETRPSSRLDADRSTDTHTRHTAHLFVWVGAWRLAVHCHLSPCRLQCCCVQPHSHDRAPISQACNLIN